MNGTTGRRSVDWRPTGTRTEFKPPESGRLFGSQHAVWRVREVDRLFEDGPLRMHAEFVAGVHPEGRGDIYRYEFDAKDFVPWYVYPDSGRWPACSCCGEPMPCSAEMLDREIAAAGKAFDRVASRLPGCCWQCGEPVSRRQFAVRYPGENLDLPGGPSVIFHTRRRCVYGAHDYEERWLAADPRRERVLTYPKCQGGLIVHADGSSECAGRVGAAEGCAGHESHDHGSVSACYCATDDGCPRGCSRVGHPGTRARRRTPRSTELLAYQGGVA